MLRPGWWLLNSNQGYKSIGFSILILQCLKNKYWYCSGNILICISGPNYRSRKYKYYFSVTWLIPESGSEPTKSQMVNQKTISLLTVNTRTKHSLIKSSKNVTNNGSNLLMVSIFSNLNSIGKSDESKFWHFSCRRSWIKSGNRKRNCRRFQRQDECSWLHWCNECCSSNSRTSRHHRHESIKMVLFGRQKLIPMIHS